MCLYISTSLQRCALRADAICRFFELALDFVFQLVVLPRRTIAFADSSSAKMGMCLCSIIAHADYYGSVKWANRCGTGASQRSSNNSSEIVSPAITGHVRLLSELVLLSPKNQEIGHGAAPKQSQNGGSLIATKVLQSPR
jgi:hypothetical protein